MTLRRSALFLLSLAVALAIWGFLIEPSRLVLRQESFSRWPGEPLTIAFIADLHAGSPYITEEYVRGLVAQVNAQNPDLILIGGDLVINHVLGGKFIPIETVTSLLKDLKAPMGAYAVLGNHDLWNNGEEIRTQLNRIGITVLENESRVLNYKGSRFNLVGVGDDQTGHTDLGKSLSSLERDMPTLLLMHDPGSLLNLEQPFTLALAAHLHGGQVALPWFGALITPGRAPRAWARGWSELKTGPLFVTAGIGTSILPVRFNSPPEFVILRMGKAL